MTDKIYLTIIAFLFTLILIDLPPDGLFEILLALACILSLGIGCFNGVRSIFQKKVTFHKFDFLSLRILFPIFFLLFVQFHLSFIKNKGPGDIINALGQIMNGRYLAGGIWLIILLAPLLGHYLWLKRQVQASPLLKNICFQNRMIQFLFEQIPNIFLFSTFATSLLGFISYVIKGYEFGQALRASSAFFCVSLMILILWFLYFNTIFFLMLRADPTRQRKSWPSNLTLIWIWSLVTIELLLSTITPILFLNFLFLGGSMTKIILEDRNKKIEDVKLTPL